jgi:hypothetical protein
VLTRAVGDDRVVTRDPPERQRAAQPKSQSMPFRIFRASRPRTQAFFFTGKGR